MGCDIHGWVEVKVGDKYVAIKDIGYDVHARQRNYGRFAALANVRNYDDVDFRPPQGVPQDVSDTAKYHIDQWASDGHSHSYMPLNEAAEIFSKTYEGEHTWYMEENPVEFFFELDEGIEGARLVFWFDN